MLSFSFLDYILVPSYFYEFLVYRLIGLLGYVFAGTVILIMIHKVGGTQSPYYVGLIVIMTIYITLTPLTLSQTLIFADCRLSACCNQRRIAYYCSAVVGIQ